MIPLSSTGGVDSVRENQATYRRPSTMMTASGEGSVCAFLAVGTVLA